MIDGLLLPIFFILAISVSTIFADDSRDSTILNISHSKELCSAGYKKFKSLPFGFELNVLNTAEGAINPTVEAGLFSLSYHKRPLALWKMKDGKVQKVTHLAKLPNEEHFASCIEYFLKMKEDDLSILSFEEELNYFDSKPKENAEEELIKLCGGKGASLALNTNFDSIQTPIGASVSTDFYFEFLRKNPSLKNEISELLHSFDAQNAIDRERLEAKVKEKILKSPIPEELEKKIQAYYSLFNFYSFLNSKGDLAELAVRSSGVSEDMKVSSWIPLSSGSQAGQGDSFLDVKGYDSISENVKKVWASLFNDRALQYRDDQAFIQWTGELDSTQARAKKAYEDLIDHLNKDLSKADNVEETKKVILDLGEFRNPGTKNLERTLLSLSSDEKYTPYLNVLNNCREMTCNPEKLGMGVVVMEMCKSFCSGVGFTVHTGTKNGAIAKAIDAYRNGDKSIVSMDEETGEYFVKPLIVEFEVNWGYGESVVSGRVNPDRFLMASCDGDNWFILEKHLGSKELQTLSTSSILAQSNDLFGMDHDLIQDMLNLESYPHANMEHYLQKSPTELLACEDENYHEMLSELFPSSKDVDAKKKFISLSELITSLRKGHFTTEIYNTKEHTDNFVVSASDAKKVAQMITSTAKARNDTLVDIEFGIEKTNNGEFTFQPAYHLNGAPITPSVKGRLINLQTRPYTGEVLGVTYARSVTEMDQSFVRNKKIQPIAFGTRGESATWGIVYSPQSSTTLPEQVKDIQRIQSKELSSEEMHALESKGVNVDQLINDEEMLPVILYLEEAEPKHNPLMQEVKKRGAVVTNKGGETSHAAIYTREQRIPACCGIGEAHIGMYDLVMVDANNGRIYPYSTQEPIPLAKHTSAFYPYLIPQEEEQKSSKSVGYIVASEHTASHISPTLLAPDAGGIALARAEFKAMDTGINPFAGYGFDLLKKLALSDEDKSVWKELPHDAMITQAMQRDLSIDTQDAAIIEKMLKHPWIEKEVQNLVEKAGYTSYKEFIYDSFLHFYRNLGFSIGKKQVNKSRAYDFSQDKVQGLIGSEVFSWPGVNPLVGLRGAALEIDGVDGHHQGNQKVLGSLFDALIDADRDTGNQGWFYVFIRSLKELKSICHIIEAKGKEAGHLPKQIGIMVEIPSNALLAKEMCQTLKQLQDRLKGDQSISGFESLFISFGTNDYTNLAGKTDREDPRIQAAKILDPIALDSIKAGQTFQPILKEVEGEVVIPQAFEGSDVVLTLIESFVKEAKDHGISSSLCGQAIVNLIEHGSQEAASKIINVLDSFGVDIKNRLKASMLLYDTERMNETIDDTGINQSYSLNSDQLYVQKGVYRGKVLHLTGAEDLAPEVPSRNEKKVIKSVIENQLDKLSKVYGKIVFIDESSPSLDELEDKEMPWDHLRYAKAIVCKEGTQSSLLNDPTIASRLKLTCSHDHFEKMTSSKELSIDFGNKKFYLTNMPVQNLIGDETLHSLDMPKAVSPFQHENNSQDFSQSDANSVYQSIGIHPLLLIHAHDADLMQKLRHTLHEKVHPVVKEVLSFEGKDEKSNWLLSRKSAEIKEQFDHLLSEKILEETKNQREAEKVTEQIVQSYLKDLSDLVTNQLNQKDPKEYLKEQMLLALNETDGTCGHIHNLCSANPKFFNQLLGGALFEEVSMNPDYGYSGPIRALGDFWQLNRIELEALDAYSKVSNQKTYARIKELKGVQTDAMLESFLNVSKGYSNSLEFIVDLSSPSNVLSTAKYHQLGINNFSFEKEVLAAAWLGADVYWKEGFSSLVDQEAMDMVYDRSMNIIFNALTESDEELSRFVL